MARRPGVGLAIAVVLIVGIGTGAVVGANGAYDIAVPDAYDLPPRTVDIQGESHTVDATLRTDPGVGHTVDVTAPAGVYRLYVYDREQRIVESRRGNGSGSFTLEFEDYAPGSYALAVNHDGDIEAVFPVVVSGYDVSHTAPSRADPDESIRVSVELTPTVATGSPADVLVVVADADGDVRTIAEPDGDRYVARVALDELDPGTYTVWAAARSDETAFGQQAILGMSRPSTIELAAPSTTTDGTGESSESTPRPSGTSPPTTAIAEASEPPGDQPASGSITASPAAGSVITPAPTGATPASNGGMPVGPVLLGLVGVIVAGFVVWRWR